MKEPDQEQQRLITQYLLGELDEAGCQLVEERLFTDGEYKEAVLMVEDELVERYVAGALAEHERERFVSHYLSTPRQRQKVKMSAALNRYANSPVPAQVTPAAPPRRPAGRLGSVLDFFRTGNTALRFSAAAAVLVVLVGGAWAIMAWRSGALRRELISLNNSHDLRLSPGPSVYAVGLSPGGLRGGGEMKRVTIPDGTRVVQLRLELSAEQHPAYQVVLQMVGGEETFRLEDLRATVIEGRRTLVLQVPARLLTHGDYTLRLLGQSAPAQYEELNDYTFRVTDQ
jgi:hypothetical protein